MFKTNKLNFDKEYYKALRKVINLTIKKAKEDKAKHKIEIEDYEDLYAFF
jgi:hypothetical protein